MNGTMTIRGVKSNKLNGELMKTVTVYANGHDGFQAQVKVILEYESCDFNQTIMPLFSKQKPAEFIVSQSFKAAHQPCFNMSTLYNVTNYGDLCPLGRFVIKGVRNPNDTDDDIKNNYASFLFVQEASDTGKYDRSTSDMLCINNTVDTIDFVWIKLSVATRDKFGLITKARSTDE